MDIGTILDNKFALSVVSATLGGIIAVVVRQITNRRGVISYLVEHSPLGISGQDPILGTVQVLWNGNEVANLFSSHVEVENVSSQDFENVEIRIYTGEAKLLTERTSVENSILVVRHTQHFAEAIAVPEGQQPRPDQWELFWHQRHYMLPVMNRGQRIHFHLLSTVPPEKQPYIWCDIQHKGVKLRYQPRRPLLVGVPLVSAAWWGVILSFLVLLGVIQWVTTPWIAALTTMVFALTASIAGALVIRILRKLRTVCNS